jgi:hypothetical protein
MSLHKAFKTVGSVLTQIVHFSQSNSLLFHGQNIWHISWLFIIVYNQRKRYMVCVIKVPSFHGLVDLDRTVCLRTQHFGYVFSHREKPFTLQLNPCFLLLFTCNTCNTWCGKGQRFVLTGWQYLLLRVWHMINRVVVSAR